MPDWMVYYAAVGSVSIVRQASGFALMENSDFILAENNDFIIYEG